MTYNRKSYNTLQAASGPLQLCAGQEAGCETVIHAMHSLFEAAILLLGADSAFNRLDHAVALHGRDLCDKLLHAMAQLDRNFGRKI